MIQLEIKPKATKFIRSLPPKHQRQIKDSILSLQNHYPPHDAKKLVGYENYNRIDIGEYRIIYRYESKLSLLTIVLVGKRNDDEVYKTLKRML